jgi:hypothetical protein
VADPEFVTAPAIDVGGPLIDVTGDVRPGRAMLVRRVPLALGQTLLIAITLFVLVGGWQRDFHVPFGFSSDSLWFLMQSKSTVDHGWWWSNPRLGAPFGLDERAYPSNSHVDQAIVWAVSRLVPDAFAATNIAWMAIVILSGLSATWCLRKLGISTLNAMVCGTLFALSPYALYRHIDHFSLVIYLVPFACTAALWLASGRPLRAWPATTPAIVLIGCALLSFDYVYYAFFGAFVILVGALVGYLAVRDRRVLASGGICLAVIVGCTLINLAPSFASWHERGQPMVLRDKVPAEAEMFGLKIRQLISPVFPNRVPPFDRWVRREAAARFPNENENWTSRLGLIGTLGFLGLLVLWFVPDRLPPRAWSSSLTRSASRLTLATLLLATVGGFGSLFSLFLSSDIRAYNRMCPFIEFFALVAVALAVDTWCTSTRARTAVAVVVLAIGLADQGQAAQHFTTEYAGIAREIAGLDAFDNTLEHALPANTMVLQLPFRAYMNESDVGGMKRYDHFKPYLVSHALRFSYPAFSNEQVRWQQAAARLPLRDLMPQLASEGFAGVLIDRQGYEDRGAEVSAALIEMVGQDRIIAQSDRYLALNISALAARTSPASKSLAAAMSSDLAPASESLGACKGPSLTVIDQMGTTHAPFGTGVIHVAGSGAIKVSGWAVDHPHRKAAAAVDVVVDTMPFPSAYGAARDDVADYFQRPGYRESGFTADVPAEKLTAGEHAVSLRVVSSDGQCYYQTRSMPMTVDR